jgi:hypothetical protein
MRRIAVQVPCLLIAVVVADRKVLTSVRSRGRLKIRRLSAFSKDEQMSCVLSVNLSITADR